jgi:hypothetical protein
LYIFGQIRGPFVDFIRVVIWIAVNLKSGCNQLSTKILHFLFQELDSAAKMFIGTVAGSENGKFLAMVGFLSCGVGRSLPTGFNSIG